MLLNRQTDPDIVNEAGARGDMDTALIDAVLASIEPQDFLVSLLIRPQVATPRYRRSIRANSSFSICARISSSGGAAESAGNGSPSSNIGLS